MILNEKPSLLFILGFLLTTAYIPGIIGAAIPTSWLVLIIAAPICFIFCKTNLNINSCLIFGFVLYCTLSFFWTENFYIAFFHYLQIIALACTFYIGVNLKDLKPVFKGLASGLGISGIIAILQYLDYKPVYSLYSNITGLFVNPNIYSEVTIIILIGLIVLKLWWWIPLVLPGIVLIHSRTALAALGFGLLMLLFKRNKLYAFASFLIVGIISLYLYKNSFNILSIQERVNLYKDTINGITLFGHGVGSFEILYPFYATNIDTSLARPRYTHNDWLQLIFEFGIFTLLLVALVINIMRKWNDKIAILCSIGIVSCFAFPFHIAVSAFVACLVAGHISSNHGAIWNTRDNSGSILS